LKIQVGRHAGAFIESQLFGAKESVRICSPWISPRYVRWLFSLAKDGVSIRVITADFGKNGRRSSSSPSTSTARAA
jgi:hypothetical protein